MKAIWYWMLAGLFVLMVVCVALRVARPSVEAALKPASQTMAPAQAMVASKARSPDVAYKLKMLTASTMPVSVKSITAVVAPMRPLPQKNTPWAALYAQLNDRAKGGDRLAATRLYRDMMKCNRYLIARSQANAEAVNPVSAASIPDGRLKDTTAYLDSIQQTLKADADICSAASNASLATVGYSVLWNAARLGDENAAVCYVNGPPLDPPASVVDEPTARELYKSRALGLAHQGIKWGDWRMVELMASAYGPKTSLNGFGWGTMLVATSSVRQYAYVRLQWIGAVSAGAQADASVLSEQLAELGQTIPPNSIAKEDDWAQSVYNAYFINRPYVSQNGMTFCDPRAPNSDIR